MLILSQFVLRLSFGLSLAMGLTSPRKVTSGYFRNHSYVLLGLCVVATLAALANRNESMQLAVWAPLAGAILSYVSAAAWLYEKPQLGRWFLIAVAAVSLAGACIATIKTSKSDLADAIGTANVSAPSAMASELQIKLPILSSLTSGLLLGSTIAAMFLGHWYLNTPTMELAPLRKLLALMAIAVAAEAIVSGVGLALESQLPWLEPSQYPLLALHWLAGILGTAVLTWMAWQTLKIPNTQSATGILYVAVITTFIGELSSLLLSGSTGFPV